MRFKKIEFENYRCFMDGIIELEETEKKNINLIIGPNGGGKTEMLFAFWWTLYEFDFSRLQGKENTPYPLNSDLYKELEQGNIGDEHTCFVILEFEHMNTRFRVKKSVLFRKTEKQIRQESYQEFSTYNKNGELSLPIREPKEIDKQINKILPKPILDGIIFDGERMQKLSAADEKSKKAIQGVINDITNVELIENCIAIYKDIRREMNSFIKKLASQTRQSNLEELAKRISKDETIIDENTVLLEKNHARLDSIKVRLDNISDELREIEGVKLLEIQREHEKKIVENNNKLLDEYYKNFSASLKEAYLLNSTELMEAIDVIIQKIDVPVGLTVEAVKSIMIRNNCICGRCIEAKQFEKLNELILSLPPDNINSTLSEVMRQTKEKVSGVKERCKQNYKYITDCEENIKKSKERIITLSSQILGFNAEVAQELEKDNGELQKEKLKLEIDNERLRKELRESKEEREMLISQRENLGRNNEETNRLNKQLDFIEKCLKAFDSIKNRNKEKALAVINSKLQVSYEKLSEDAVLGNAIYIVQYEEAYKYQMVVYIKRKMEELINIWKETNIYSNYLSQGLSVSEIEEKAILACADSNSTGQSKMNTLSFAKAILDYSNEQKDKEGVEIQKEYPILIDAPFSDIAGDNLRNAARELHNFSGQVVLMIDGEKYKSIRQHISSYVNKLYKLDKNSEQNVTSIKEEVQEDVDICK